MTSRALVVAVTGWGHEEDRRRTREMGFAMHLVKPVTLEDLRAMLAGLNQRCRPTVTPNLSRTSPAGDRLVWHLTERPAGRASLSAPVGARTARTRRSIP